MDFIVVCPHCGAYVGVDRLSFFDVDYYNRNNGSFYANGTLHCDSCNKNSVLDVYLEPVEYKVSKMEE